MESFAADCLTGWGAVLLFMQLMALLQPMAFVTGGKKPKDAEAAVDRIVKELEGLALI